MKLSPPSLAGLQHVLANLRALDREEIECTSAAFDPHRRAFDLWAMWQSGDVLFAQVASADDDEPVALLMFAWLTPVAASVGLLATERWGEISAAFARHCRASVRPAVMATGVRRIECRVYDRHADARRWLYWFGAREECRLTGWGKGGEEFIQYAWTRRDA